MYKKAVVIVILIIILFVVCYLGYSYYSYKCYIYNQIILEEVETLMKGNISYDKIETLEVPNEIKEQLKNYYDKTFYNDDDKILVFGNIDIYDRIKGTISDVYLSSGDVYSYLQEFYGELFDVYMSLSDDLTDEEMGKINEINFFIMYQNKSTNHRYIKENNNLYIMASDIIFDDGVYECNYDGLSTYLLEDILEKKVKQSLVIDENIQNLRLNIVSENFGIDIYSLGKLGSFSVEKKLGKIKSIEF